MTHSCDKLKPCFLPTFAQYKYLEVLVWKSGAQKSKYTFKPVYPKLASGKLVLMKFQAIFGSLHLL